ncbi:MAG: hypothetical protein KIT27_05655 [Legionellales bacterium]|nr:hypothetical protein [Legionellales bacterium]
MPLINAIRELQGFVKNYPYLNEQNMVLSEFLKAVDGKIWQIETAILPGALGPDVAQYQAKMGNFLALLDGQLWSALEKLKVDENIKPKYQKYNLPLDFNEYTQELNTFKKEYLVTFYLDNSAEQSDFELNDSTVKTRQYLFWDTQLNRIYNRIDELNNKFLFLPWKSLYQEITSIRKQLIAIPAKLLSAEHQRKLHTKKANTNGLLEAIEKRVKEKEECLASFSKNLVSYSNMVNSNPLKDGLLTEINSDLARIESYSDPESEKIKVNYIALKDELIEKLNKIKIEREARSKELHEWLENLKNAQEEINIFTTRCKNINSDTTELFRVKNKLTNEINVFKKLINNWAFPSWFSTTEKVDMSSSSNFTIPDELTYQAYFEAEKNQYISQLENLTENLNALTPTTSDNDDATHQPHTTQHFWPTRANAATTPPIRIPVSRTKKNINGTGDDKDDTQSQTSQNEALSIAATTNLGDADSESDRDSINYDTVSTSSEISMSVNTDYNSYSHDNNHPSGTSQSGTLSSDHDRSESGSENNDVTAANSDANLNAMQKSPSLAEDLNNSPDTDDESEEENEENSFFFRSRNNEKRRIFSKKTTQAPNVSQPGLFARNDSLKRNDPPEITLQAQSPLQNETTDSASNSNSFSDIAQALNSSSHPSKSTETTTHGASTSSAGEHSQSSQATAITTQTSPEMEASSSSNQQSDGMTHSTITNTTENNQYQSSRQITSTLIPENNRSTQTPVQFSLDHGMINILKKIKTELEDKKRSVEASYCFFDKSAEIKTQRITLFDSHITKIQNLIEDPTTPDSRGLLDKINKINTAFSATDENILPHRNHFSRHFAWWKPDVVKFYAESANKIKNNILNPLKITVRT